jgi:precorrin-2 dehydrogenase / sirohydrochlorin ferrochelatase
MAEESPTPHYPAFLDLKSRLVVLVGSGLGLERKVQTLLRYGADIVVICSESTEILRQMEAEGLITVEERAYQSGDLQGATLAICMGASTEVAQAVYQDSLSLSCLVNVPKHPEFSTYLVPSAFRRGALQVAVSTAGTAPTAAKRLRDTVRDTYGDAWGVYVELLAAVHARAHESMTDPVQREQTLALIADADLLSRIVAGEALTADGILAEFAGPSDDAAGAAGDDEE